jgi:dienelactone hydrolase
VQPARSLAVLAVLVAALGVGGLVRADSELTRAQSQVSGVPLYEIHPAGTSTPRPGVVVAHGFAGSAVLMRQFGDTLAARGRPGRRADVADRSGGVGAARSATGHGAAGDRVSAR